LEHAAKAGGHEVASGTKRVVTDARVIGDKLLGGSGYVVDKVGECIAAVGKEVEKAGKGIESLNRE
jgi:phage-related tail protein